MKQLTSPTKRVKAGTGKAAAAARREAFVQAYLANGHNATQAAITAGYSAKTAYSKGQQLLKRVETSRELAEMARKTGEDAGLTTGRVLEKLEHALFCDQRKLVNPDGTPKSIHELDDATAAAVAGVDPETGAIKTYDALRALDMAMKHVGLCQGLEELYVENDCLESELTREDMEAIFGLAR